MPNQMSQLEDEQTRHQSNESLSGNGGAVGKTLSLSEESETAVLRNLSPELRHLLKNLAETTGSSITDILGKGLVLIGAAIKAKEKGLRLGMADENGRFVKEIIGF